MELLISSKCPGAAKIIVIWSTLSSTSETLPLARGSWLGSGEGTGPVAWRQSTAGERVM